MSTFQLSYITETNLQDSDITQLIDHTNINNIGVKTHLEIDDHINQLDIHKAINQDLNTTDSPEFVKIQTTDIDTTSDIPLNIGTVTAAAVNIGKTGSTTVVKGNLLIQGDTVTNNVSEFKSEDPLIHLGSGYNSTSDNRLIGFFGEQKTDGNTYYSGIIRDHTVDKFKLFSNITTLPTNTNIPISNGTLLTNAVEIAAGDIQTLLDGKSDIHHSHTVSNIDDFTTSTNSLIDLRIDDNDTTDKLWTAQKITNEIAAVSGENPFDQSLNTTDDVVFQI
jgi:hypothetical protein